MSNSVSFVLLPLHVERRKRACWIDKRKLHTNTKARGLLLTPVSSPYFFSLQKSLCVTWRGDVYVRCVRRTTRAYPDYRYNLRACIYGIEQPSAVAVPDFDAPVAGASSRGEHSRLPRAPGQCLHRSLVLPAMEPFVLSTRCNGGMVLLPWTDVKVCLGPALG